MSENLVGLQPIVTSPNDGPLFSGTLNKKYIRIIFPSFLFISEHLSPLVKHIDNGCEVLGMEYGAGVPLRHRKLVHSGEARGQ